MEGLVGDAGDDLQHLRGKLIFVFGGEADNVVFDWTAAVVDLEILRFASRHGHYIGLGVVLHEGLRQRGIRLIQLAAFVDEVQHPQWIVLDQIYDRLVILEVKFIRELFQSLLEELVLLFLEDVADIELLQLLIGEVDEELLEAVALENFEAEDVQDTDALARGSVLAEVVHVYLL